MKDPWHTPCPPTLSRISYAPLLQRDKSKAVSSFYKAELFAQTFAINSILDNIGHISPILSPSDYFVPKIKILHNDVFHVLLGLNSRKANGMDRFLPVALKNCASSELTTSLVKLICLCLFTSTYPLCWKFAQIQHVPKFKFFKLPPYSLYFPSF